MAPSQRYRVYVWKSPQAKAASVVQDVNAQSIDNAIQSVLLTYQIALASYVWVVSPDDESIDVHRYKVSCRYMASLVPVGAVNAATSRRPARSSGKRGGR